MKTLKVKVKPGSGKQEIIKKDDYYLVCLKSKAEDNKANIELLKLMKKKFKKDFEIIKGAKSREKILKCQ